MTYEPYLSAVRAKPEAGKIIATTLDYPMVMGTFGCTPAFLEANAEAVQGAGRQLFPGTGDDREQPEQAYEIMGPDVKQTGEQFAASAKYPRCRTRGQPDILRGRDREPSPRRRPTCSWNWGSSRQVPVIESIIDTRFIE